MTLAEARAYLAELGLELPDTILSCLITRPLLIQECMDRNGYDTCTQSLIGYYLVGLLSITSGGRRVKSQTAPSGASRSFEYGTLDQQAGQLRNALALLDPFGCASGLVPAPIDAVGLGVFVGNGSPQCGC